MNEQKRQEMEAQLLVKVRARGVGFNRGKGVTNLSSAPNPMELLQGATRSSAPSPMALLQGATRQSSASTPMDLLKGAFRESSASTPMDLLQGATRQSSAQTPMALLQGATRQSSAPTPMSLLQGATRHNSAPHSMELQQGATSKRSWTVEAAARETEQLNKLAKKHAALFKHRAPTLLPMLQTGQFSDYRLQCDKKVINVHKVVLASGSTVFAQLIRKDPNLCIVTETDFDTLSLLVRFLYSGQVDTYNLSPNRIISLLAAAQKFQVEMVKEGLEAALMDVVSVESVVDYLVIGEELQLMDLKDMCLSFIRQHSREIQEGNFRAKLKDYPHLRNVLFELTFKVGGNPGWGKLCNQVTAGRDMVKDVKEEVGNVQAAEQPVLNENECKSIEEKLKEQARKRVMVKNAERKKEEMDGIIVE